MPILCELTKVSSVEKHDNADSLEIVPFEGFLTITQIGRLKVGDYVVYLAPGSILPDNLLKEMGLFDEVKQQGCLSGSGGARVKPKKLRGVVSEGIMYGPIDPARVCEMFNVTSADDALGFEAKDLLGVTKFDPNVFDVQTGRRLGGGDPSMCFDSRSSDQHKYDIENIKKHNRSLERFFAENDVDIVITEKVHGTNFPIRLIDNASRPEEEQYSLDLCPDNILVSSKGRLEKGNWLRPDGEAGQTVYWQVAKALKLNERCADARQRYGADITLVGEIFGVQDLRYGVKTVDKISDFKYTCEEIAGEVPYVLFDVYVGDYGSGRYLDDAELEDFCTRYNIRRVPVFYRGPYDPEIIKQHTDGKETISGKELHIREGVVVRTVKEMPNTIRGLGRNQVKSISDAYHLRGNGTEFT